MIARERDRIADRLGRFIQENFLGAEVIERRLQEIDFVDQAKRWMRDPAHAGFVAERLAILSPFVLDALERAGLRDDLVAGLERRLSELEAGRALSRLLRSPLVSQNRHRLLDVALEGVLRILSSPEALAELRESMRREMPRLLKLSGGDHAVFRKVVLSLAGYIERVRADPDHALRRDFDALLDAAAAEIESSPETAARLDGLWRELLAGVREARLDEHVFGTIRQGVEREGFAPSLATELRRAMPRIADAFDLTPDEAAGLNASIRAGIGSAVSSRREQVGAFVAAQVKSWDTDDMIALVEENIGADLQYIRLNGAFVGGLAGLAIFALTRLLG